MILTPATIPTPATDKTISIDDLDHGKPIRQIIEIGDRIEQEKIVALEAARARAAALAGSRLDRKRVSRAGGAGSSRIGKLAILRCIRDAETAGPMNGRWDYRAINPAGYYGAYQFGQGTFDGVADRIGRKDLIGVRPDRAEPADQDLLAWKLFQDRGLQPWGTRARSSCAKYA